ncbi:hypothetical protein LOAG_14146 [Loa loa]|uniref:Uncharacterized protein n=1 Tax=Loa loa TaxID=7209 RepID=A0A1S0TIA4_LOALO|nr:hypothetical protein LOAG_14146 [Loa loa]EFO14375.2 hypothetical protein LOAG_14146 [Loa loa]
MNRHNIGNITMNHYHILFYHIIIISTIITATIANPASNKPDNNESDNGGNLPEEYFDIAKRSKNSYSWMNTDAIRSPSRDLFVVLEKPAPLNPYSWQYMVKKKEPNNFTKSLFVDESS